MPTTFSKGKVYTLEQAAVGLGLPAIRFPFVVDQGCLRAVFLDAKKNPEAPYAAEYPSDARHKRLLPLMRMQRGDFALFMKFSRGLWEYAGQFAIAEWRVSTLDLDEGCCDPGMSVRFAPRDA